MPTVSPDRSTGIRLFRRGAWYESYDSVATTATGPRLCLAPQVMIHDDVRRMRAALGDWSPVTLRRRRQIVSEAVTIFRDARMPVGGIGVQAPGDLARTLEDLCGLPAALVSRWIDLLTARTADMLAAERATALPILPAEQPITLVWLPGNTFTCLEAVCAAVLDSAAVIIRPSRREPVAAARFVAALLEAGWPPERLGFYPSHNRLLADLVGLTDRQVVYGGPEVARLLPPGVTGLDLRGPGRGCAVVRGEPDVPATVKELVHLIAADSGRFCTNVCTVLCLGASRELGNALAEVLDGISAWPVDSRWPLAACSPSQAEWAAGFITGRLSPADAILTRRDLVIQAGGRTYLAPTLVHVRWTDDDPSGHPLSGVELPFPFATITTVDHHQLGHSLARSAYVHRFPEDHR